jgi:hypothetical protein
VDVDHAMGGAHRLTDESVGSTRSEGLEKSMDQIGSAEFDGKHTLWYIGIRNSCLPDQLKCPRQVMFLGEP